MKSGRNLNGGELDAIEIEKTESSVDAYINIDNSSLRREINKNSKDAATIEEQFVWGMVITGLAIKETIEEKKMEEGAEELFRISTRSMAKVILPIIRGLGKMEDI